MILKAYARKLSKWDEIEIYDENIGKNSLYLAK